MSRGVDIRITLQNNAAANRRNTKELRPSQPGENLESGGVQNSAHDNNDDDGESAALVAVRSSYLQRIRKRGRR